MYLLNAVYRITLIYSASATVIEVPSPQNIERIILLLVLY